MSSESDSANSSSVPNSAVPSSGEVAPTERQPDEIHTALDASLQVPPPALIPCRRCGKRVPETLANCPFCDARLPGGHLGPTPLLVSSAKRPTVADHGTTHTAINRLLIFYLILLCTNLFASWFVFAWTEKHLNEEQIEALTLPLIVGIEIFDAILVLVALYVVPRPPAIGPSSPKQRRIGWLMAPIIFAVVLGLNFGYHALIQNYVQFPNWEESDSHIPIGWAIITICMQPGIIEELFFRYIALGTLRRVMGVIAAIAVSSVMFGMAHSSVALSIPILTVVGAGLGLIRVWSGSMLLPMLLHALHNTIVLYFETVK
jgi:uncharacterized protein